MNRICGIVILMLFVTLSASAQNPVNSKPDQPDLEGDLMLDFGFNYWSSKPSQLPMKTLGSNSVGIYYNRRLRISDRISFYPAAGFTFDKYAFNGDYAWVRNGGTVSLDSIGLTYDKNKLVVGYFEIPVEFRIHPLKTEKGEGWFIGVGGVAGLKIGAHTKTKYSLGGDDYKEKLYGQFDLKNYRYGLQFRFGFRGIHLFYKMYMSEVFNTTPDPNGKKPMAGTLGISVSGF
ncbi:PorT family protein [Marinoscillum sp. MHG1-6]|uniref:PorT family protein n=1 Tax=Marinoscillum sp. MHG1-6 TaxID=2959627 RepID=UPI002158653F|nr:PorT family protein [Marinoscillum sp. MHG1-6]